ncbi:Toxin 1, PIN domain [Serinicoccus hydrothermalis]|uniref:Ribonuclease VapC n=1 Tax=Serinicoccus hydrothermalis TaxID=1758689 RepID=A0A1B1NEH1_9MICO|nr:type II toxin-antitoxin system VapC family toxin [Serinicoccus hydrothermalis]ANS79847.1 Toxin 1, PIN domain [Serinicoccus hydrothermalis]
MILDSSALLAILQGEEGFEDLARTALAGQCRMSAATWLEVGIVADQRSSTHGARLDDLLRELAVEVVPVTARDAEVARTAYRRFGRGSGHPARLNYGDCFSYALSVTSGEPLLFVGDDLAATDVLPARR